MPERRVAEVRTSACCFSVSSSFSRMTAKRPSSERFRKRDKVVIRESGNALSPMRGSAPLTSTTTPTWFVHVPVAVATSRKGLKPIRTNTRSPTLSAEAMASSASGDVAAAGGPASADSVVAGATATVPARTRAADPRTSG